MKIIPALLTLFILIACGDNSPFDEDYWDEDLRDRAEEEQSTSGRYSANLSAVSALGFTNADAILDLDGNAVFLRIEIQGVPENVFQGQILIMDESCETLVTSTPTSGSLGIKNLTYTENSTRRALLLDDTTNESVEGKFLVIYATSAGTITTPARSSFPLACGPIVRPQDAGVTTSTGGVAGATAGGFNTGTTGATVNGGTIGAIGGGTAGTVDGGVGGGTVGTVGGVTGGTNGGFTAGGTAGGITDGTTGATTGTAAGINGGFTTGGTFGGSLGF